MESAALAEELRDAGAGVLMNGTSFGWGEGDSKLFHHGSGMLLAFRF